MKQKRNAMSKEWIFKTLLNQGIPQIEAQIYVFLAIEGPKNPKNIGRALNLNKYKLSHSLTHLINIGIINEIPECPAMLSALSFDKVLGMLLEIKKAQAKNLQENRDSLISSWHEVLDDNHQSGI